MCGFRTVTSINELSRCSRIRFSFGSMPTAQRSLNERAASARSSMDWSTLCSMTGLYTLSWKFPCEPAKATAWSFPKTCTATMVRASHCNNAVSTTIATAPTTVPMIRNQPSEGSTQPRLADDRRREPGPRGVVEHRGLHFERRVVMMNRDDMNELGLSPRQVVDVVSHFAVQTRAAP